MAIRDDVRLINLKDLIYKYCKMKVTKQYYRITD